MRQSETDTIIVSDIHLGLPGSRPKELLGLLQSWRFRRLILLGDIFHDKALRHLCADTWRLLRHIRALNAEAKTEVVWIMGNHDRAFAPLVAKLMGVRTQESFSWTCGGRAFHAVHGDCFDSFISNYARLAGAMSRLYAFLLRGLAPGGAWSTLVDRLHLRLSRLGEDVLAGARSYAQRHELDVIVCGHTHQPQHLVFESPCGRRLEYLNSGSWLDRQASFITVGAQGAAVNHCP